MQNYVIELLRMLGASPDIENDEIINCDYIISNSSYSLDFTPDEIGVWDIYTALFNDNDLNEQVSVNDTFISSSSLATFIVQHEDSLILEDSTWGFELEDSDEEYDTIVAEDAIII